MAVLPGFFVEDGKDCQTNRGAVPIRRCRYFDSASAARLPELAKKRNLSGNTRYHSGTALAESSF
jgi:hypothetical protein